MGSRRSGSLRSRLRDDPFFDRFVDDSLLERFFSESFFAREGPAAPTGPGPGVARGQLREACEANDAKAAARALMAWAAAETPDRAPTSLSVLAGRLKIGGDVVRDLERTLYATGSTPWQGQPLWEALRGGLEERRAERHGAEPSLPPLYPQRA